MSAQTAAAATSHFRRGWVYVLTLALVTINYMDRSALGIVAQSVRGEFKLSPVEMGYLFSSFLWTYVICLLPDRHPARSLFAAQHQLHRYRAVVAGHGGDRRGVELCHPDRRPHGDGRGRGDLDSVLRTNRARMDAGAGARRRQRVLERRQLSRPRAWRGHHGGDCQRLGLARGLCRPRRAWALSGLPAISSGSTGRKR